MKRIFLGLICIFFYSTIHLQHVHAEMISRKQIEPTGQVVWEVPKKKKLIALTFDDGPHPVYTPKVLDILKQYNAHATFFQVGNRMVQYPQIVQQVVQAGHELGNHSMNHPYENKIGFEQMRTEIIQAEEIIQKYQPNKPKFYRPPGGYIDNSLLNELQQREYKVVLWSYHQDTEDWSMPGTETIADQVISQARSGDIVLLHDGGGNRSQTVEALKIILPTLKKEGYQFVSMSELLK